MICKPAVARNKYNFDPGTEGSTTKQMATSAHEVVSIIVTAGGSAAAVRIYDSANGPGAISESILIAANTGESTPYSPPQPIPFKKGIYIDFEQGAIGGEVFILTN